MLLHKTPAIFSDIVTATANDLGLQDFQIEKDYYVSLYLKTLSEFVNRQVKVSHLDNKSSFNFEPPSYFVKLPCVCVIHRSYLV